MKAYYAPGVVPSTDWEIDEPTQQIQLSRTGMVPLGNSPTIPAIPPRPDPPHMLRLRRSRVAEWLRDLRSDLIVLLPWAVLIGIGSAHLGISLLHAVAAVVLFTLAYDNTVRKWV